MAPLWKSVGVAWAILMLKMLRTLHITGTSVARSVALGKSEVYI